jgi:phenylacetate-CoA oxygenase PaaI subunit
MAEYNSVHDLPDNAKQAVYDLMLTVADSKHLLGLHYGEWLGAPVLESSIAASAMAQDEFGHSRLFYNLVEELTKGGLPEREEIPSEYRNIEVLDKPCDSWPEFIAANALIDAALLVQLEAFKNSSLAPVRRFVQKLIQEEVFHVQHAQGWIEFMVNASDEAKTVLDNAIRRIWTPVLCWLGQPDTDAEKILIELGIQDADSDDLRNRWMERIGPVLEHAHLDLPVSSDTITGEWILGTELSWDGWDNTFRRFTKTGPDAETFTQIEVFSKHEYPVGA